MAFKDLHDRLDAEAGLEPVQCEQSRARRKRAVAGSTISVTRMAKRELALGRLLYPETDHERPKTRADCANVSRPCPFVSCSHHLYLDVSPRTGAIKLNFPDLEVEDMKESCALDIADRGGATLEKVGALMNLTRERIRQLGESALLQIRASDGEEAEAPRRRLPLLPGRPKKAASGAK